MNITMAHFITHRRIPQLILSKVLLVVHTVKEEGLDAIIRIVPARKAATAGRELNEKDE